MNFLYNRQISVLMLVIAFTGLACGQNAKVKTITIVNGDTTINEEVIDDKKIGQFEKHITTVIEEDDAEPGKKVIKKKVIINDDSNEKEAFAYAYSTGDEKDEDLEITTGEN
jgi:hypothetical protein